MTTETIEDRDSGDDNDSVADDREIVDGRGTSANAHDLVRAIEAIVMVASEPIEPASLAAVLSVKPAEVDALCRRLADAYEASGAGFQLVKVAGGWRYQSHPDLAPYVERFVLEGQSARMSAAALETLAIVAYKQPISRAQIASIRGVDPDAVLRTLQMRGYVDHIGRDPGPGQAVLWGTTRLFLEKLGLDSLADLPTLVDFVPGAEVVEALEHGLRVSPTKVDAVAPTADAGGRAGGPAGAVPAPPPADGAPPPVGEYPEAGSADHAGRASPHESG